MTMMACVLAGWVLLLITSCTVCTGLQWTSGSAVTNGSTIHICEGDSVVVPWSYTTDAAEHVLNVEWYFHQQGQSDSLIATYVAGNFFKIPTASNTLEFVTNAGIRLFNVTQSQFGAYSVRINYDLHGSNMKGVQQIQIREPDPPVTSDVHLSAQLLPGTVFDNSTRQWHVMIACGHFLDTGHPPVSVTWTTPSGSDIASTGYTDGNFVLNLPNPATQGDYSCQLKVPPSVRFCDRISYQLLIPATVNVGSVSVQLSIMAARLEAVERDNGHLQQELTDVKQELQTVQQENRHLKEDLLLVPGCQDAVQKPVSCEDVRSYSAVSGVHDLYLPDNTTVRVYCDQGVDGGGWTVFQRREDGSLDFYINSTDYEDGFGDLAHEFWLGLRNIYRLTSSASYSLRVDLTDWDGSTGYALYDTFYINGPEDNYRLRISGYSGTIGDSLNYHNNIQFSTRDRDHDQFSGQCAVDYKSGWWFNDCSHANLNGQYGTASTRDYHYMYWESWHRDNRSYKRAEMKIRPRH